MQLNPRTHQKDHPPCQVDFIPEMQGRYSIKNSINVIHHINKLKERKHIVISLDAEKAFDKIQDHFIIKVLGRLGTYGTYVNIIKAVYSKIIAKIHANGETLKTIPLKSGKRHDCSPSSNLFNRVCEF